MTISSSVRLFKGWSTAAHALSKLATAWMQASVDDMPKRHSFLKPQFHTLKREISDEHPLLDKRLACFRLHHVGVQTSSLEQHHEHIIQLSTGRRVKSFQLISEDGQVVQRSCFFEMKDPSFAPLIHMTGRKLSLTHYDAPFWFEAGYIPPGHMSAVPNGKIRTHADFVINEFAMDVFEPWFQESVQASPNKYAVTNLPSPLPEYQMWTEGGLYQYHFRRSRRNTSPIDWAGEYNLMIN